MVLIICGCVLPSFSLEVIGLVGVAVQSGQSSEETSTSHNLFSIVKLLSDQASFLGTTSDYVGLVSLAAILIFTVLIAPLLQVLFLMMRWFVPMEKQRKYRNFIFTEALQAWQYMEVYIFAVIVTTWQLGSVSEFMINDYCGGLEDFFISAIYNGLLSESNAQCFRVNADVKIGMWILFSASILLVILNHFVRTASRQEEQDEIGTTSYAIEECISPHARGGSISSGISTSQAEEVSHQIKGIDGSHYLVLPPPLFTDYYQYFLGSTDNSSSS